MRLQPKLRTDKLVLVVILLLAALVRFGGLTWCSPYTPHPDEWNMARAITQMSWEEKLNPNFFAYGQFPLYLSYFSATLYNLLPWMKIKTINIQEAIFFLRFWSAVAGVSTVYLIYLISRKLTLKKPLIAPLLAVFTPGLIQISHFGTTESLLSFFFLWVVYLSLKIIESQKVKYFFLLAVPLGLSFGSKITALIFTVPVIIGFILNLKKKSSIKKYLLTLTLTLTLTFLCSPYLVLAFKELRGTLLYETSVATGQSQVFYTRQFVNTPPVFFQLQKIFPYALGWPIFILGSLGLLFSLFSFTSPKSRKSLNTKYLILNTSFLFYFLSQAFLFCKWTRFMAPIFAFFPLFAGILLNHLRNLRYLGYLAVISALIPGIFFSTVYFSPDIRFTASNWIYKNIPSGSKVLFDTGNVVDIPISSPYSLTPNNYHLSTVSFDFYQLDENPSLYPELIEHLEMADYIIVLSRRVFTNHLRFPKKFPLTAKYYQLLFSGELGFTPVAVIEPLYSKIFKDEQAEETFSVFDHPTIRIYKKRVFLTRNDYENLLK